ncbi:MAG TPA: hypothetical protein PLW86_10845 [Rhodocyclaceae bacterium]|nr:hypothetical protein [Rhodocyclaceae bacterium]
MSKMTRLATALIASALISSPAFAQGKAVVTVNGQAISQGVYDIFLAEQLAQGQADSPALRAQLKDRLIAQELLVQEAKRKGADKKSEYVNRLEILKNGLLVNVFLTDYVKSHPASDDQLKKDYEAIKAALGSTEYKARHILVDKEDEAKAIIAKLDKG